MRRLLVSPCALALLAASATPCLAQDTGGLANVLLSFFQAGTPVVVLRPNPDPARSHAAHFQSQGGVQDILTELNAGIAAQISTFPLGSSSAGFAYTFDESLGTYNRATDSFGPVFTERPLTSGKGKFTLGVNYQDASWDTFEGKDLGNGDIQLFLVHEDTNRDGTTTDLFFEGDLIQANVRIDLETKTTVAYANYGVSERFDLSVAVPFVDVTLNAAIDTSIERLSTEGTGIHFFDDGTSNHTYTAPGGGSASGIGDVLLRGKWNFLRKPSGSLAAFVDLRLPTGDEADLLGSGATQARFSLVAGGSTGAFSPRASLGYTFSSGGSDFTGDLPDELYYTAGFDIVPHSRVTLTADFIGRTLLDARTLVDTQTTFRHRAAALPTAPIIESTRTELGIQTGNLSLLLASAGIKVNPVGRLLLVGNVLFKIGDHGLQADVIPSFGLGYTF
jgi:hypothetical protein